MRFQDKVVVLTGGGSDIGIACAEQFLREGAKIVLVDINQELLDKIEPYRMLFGNQVRTIVGSVCEIADMEKAMAFAAGEFGSVDILVNLAGMNGKGKVDEMTLESWNMALKVTLTGTFHACRAAIPYMKVKKYGRIINVASLGGRAGRPVNCAYAASKAAVCGLGRSLAMELAPWKITVNTVAPGPLNGGIFKKNQMDDPEKEKERKRRLEESVVMGRLGELGEIAYGVLYLADDEAAWTTGEILDINGGAYMC